MPKIIYPCVDLKQILLVSYFLISSLCWTAVSQTLQWNVEQTITMNTMGANIRPRLIALDSSRGIILWGNEQSQSIHYSLWENRILGMPKTLNINQKKAFITNWASTEMAGRRNVIYIVFKEDPAETGKIYLIKSLDYGQTFSTPIVVVDPNNFYCRFPGISIDQSQQPIISYMRFKTDWSQPEYVSIRSHDFGETFDPYTLVTNPNLGEACDCCPVSMETDSNRVAVFYRNNRNNIRNMAAAVSENNGTTYDLVAELDTANWQVFNCPSTGGDGFFADSFLHTAWTSGRTGSSKAYYSRLNLRAKQVDGFSGIDNALGRDFQQTYPRIAGHQDTVAIVWGELVQNMDIFFSYFTNHSYQLLSSNTLRVNSKATGHQGSPDIDYNQSVFYICWQDLSDNSIKFKTAEFSIHTETKEATNHPVVSLEKTSFGYRVTLAHEASAWTLYGMNGIRIQQGNRSSQFEIHIENPGLYVLALTHGSKTVGYKLMF